MRIEDSLSFFLFTYEESEETIRKCVTSLLDTTQGCSFKIIVIDNSPGWNLSESIMRIGDNLLLNGRIRTYNNILNQGQARNWNQITRLTLLDGNKWCGIIAPDTIVLPGWLEAANEQIDKLDLIGHLNFSVFKAETIKKLGWFDERHVSGGSEDLDMYCRFEEANIPFDRFYFENKKLQLRGGENQYRNTTENVARFREDDTYWRKKWRVDKSVIPPSDIVFDIKKRRRNWEEINWYPHFLDRDFPYDEKKIKKELNKQIALEESK